MAPRLKPTISKAHKEKIRQAAIARHAARKAAGLPAPSGLPYILPPAPPAPEPAEPTVPEPPASPAPAPEPVADPTPLSEVAPTLLRPVPAAVCLTPREAFKVWLRTRDGLSAADPRMSHDPVRFGAELEDRIFAAWQAGHLAGRASA